MGKILILVDNSNVFISGKEVYDDETVRFSYSAFERICAGEDDIIEKHLAGSVPPSSDAFWRKMENAGYHVHTYERQSAGYGRTKEKGVDMILGLRGVLAIYRLKPDRVVLLSGDCDFMPLAKLRDDMKEEGSTFTLDVWSFEDSLSSELSKVADRTFYIDDYEDKLIYFQSADGHTESFTEHADRIEKEKAEAKARMRAEKEKRERIARERAEAEARVRAEEERERTARERAEAEARTRAEEEKKRIAREEAEAEARTRAEEEVREKAEAEKRACVKARRKAIVKTAVKAIGTLGLLAIIRKKL